MKCYSTLQADIAAINKTAEPILSLDLLPTRIAIYTDSQAAIKALSAYKLNSKCILDCRRSLLSIHQHTIWLVPAHSNVQGNKAADKLAKEGLGKTIATTDRKIYPNLKTIQLQITTISENEASTRYSHLDGCLISRTLWPRRSKEKTEKLLTFSRQSLRNLIGIITGHIAVGNMATRLGISNNDLCRGCEDEEEIESVEHFLCHCPGLKERRLRILGSRFFDDLGDIEKKPLNRLHRFIKESGWFR